VKKTSGVMGRVIVSIYASIGPTVTTATVEYGETFNWFLCLVLVGFVWR